MTEERRQVLDMLVQGKVTAEEADRLLAALAAPTYAETAVANVDGPPPAAPKFLRVLVESESDGKPSKVNVRVPFELIRAGVRLAALLPAVAHEPVNRALQERGISVDISKIKLDDFESLVSHLQELSVDVDDGNEKVRVFCE